MGCCDLQLRLDYLGFRLVLLVKKNAISEQINTQLLNNDLKDIFSVIGNRFAKKGTKE